MSIGRILTKADFDMVHRRITRVRLVPFVLRDAKIMKLDIAAHRVPNQKDRIFVIRADCMAIRAVLKRIRHLSELENGTIRSQLKTLPRPLYPADHEQALVF